MGSASKKRCQVGKSCGASCIQRSKFCLMGLSQNISKGANNVVSVIKSASPGTMANDFLTEIVDEKIENEGISKQVGNKNYNWDDSKGPNSKRLGDGQYGVVDLDKSSGHVVKRGSIGLEEVELLDKLASKNLGPKVHAAEVDGKGFEANTKVGRIAMDLVPGKPIGFNRKPDAIVGGEKVSDAFWKARAELHRLGVAHNDMHPGNAIIDKNGNARFIDLGLGQNSSKAALAEALGAFSGPILSFLRRGDLVKGAKGGGDWQVLRWASTGGKLLAKAMSATATQADKDALAQKAPILNKIMRNFFKVSSEMAKDGYTVPEISALVSHGIRSSNRSFTQGVWGKITEDQISKYINMLYDGV
jgi:serine/threonine protein kinase